MHTSVCRIADDAPLLYLLISICSCYPVYSQHEYWILRGGDFSKGGRAHVELWKTEGVENRSRSIFCSQYAVFNPIRRKPWND